MTSYISGKVRTKWFLRDFMEVLRMESAAEGTKIRVNDSPSARPTSPGSKESGRQS